jgi:hypothetical protein
MSWSLIVSSASSSRPRARLRPGHQLLGPGPVHHRGITVARATVPRRLSARGLIVPDTKKRPKSSYNRFAAGLPDERWHAGFTHHRLTRCILGRVSGEPDRKKEADLGKSPGQPW